MLAELVDHVIGVDPDRDWITVAALDAQTSGVIANDRFPATRDGYRDAVLWADAHSDPAERAWVIEGASSYGRGLAMVLQRNNEFVVEFDHPTRKATKDGAKSDALDAIRAAREALGRDKLNEPRAHDGIREAIRVHTVARAAAVRARTAAINELKAFAVTADEQLRSELRGLRRPKLVVRCARFRDSTNRPIDQRCTRNAMRALARRIQHLTDETAEHDRVLKELIDQAAPQLIAERGIGYVTAAAFYLAWSHPGRCRSEAAFARLGGTAPIETTSGQNQTRHRLCRSGDRHLNRALYLVAVTRQRSCPETRDYMQRRTAHGKTKREATRCLKRFIARRVWRLLEHPKSHLDNT